MNNNICQSCGMPMNKEGDFGTNAEGSKNQEYCHFCYQVGKFTDPDISKEEFIEKQVKNAITRMGMSEDEARKKALIIPTLNRWKVSSIDVKQKITIKMIVLGIILFTIATVFALFMTKKPGSSSFLIPVFVPIITVIIMFKIQSKKK